MPESAIGAAIASFAGSSTAGAIGTAVATTLAGAVVSKALAPKTPDAATKVQSLTAAQKPAAVQEVDPAVIQKKNAALAASSSLGGSNSTLLSGAQGVNPSSLNLGQNTLLGS